MQSEKYKDPSSHAGFLVGGGGGGIAIVSVSRILLSSCSPGPHHPPKLDTQCLPDFTEKINKTEPNQTKTECKHTQTYTQTKSPYSLEKLVCNSPF